MTSVLKGGFGSPNGAPLLATNSGTEFVNTVCPLKGALDGYDNTIPCRKQKIHVPQNFCDAMAIREEVYGEQGVPLEAEFDEDDARSWHWVAYCFHLQILAPYRSLGLAKLLVNAALDYAMMNPDLIYRPPSPTALEMAQMLGNNKEREITWQGLVMIHAQANLQSMWEKHGFHEELRNDDGEVEIPAEPHWIEEGIEHVGMWKRLSVEKRKRLSLSSLDSS
ncbi:unnamed protein product [Alternaria alternata]